DLHSFPTRRSSDLLSSPACCGNPHSIRASDVPKLGRRKPLKSWGRFESSRGESRDCRRQLRQLERICSAQIGAGKGLRHIADGALLLFSIVSLSISRSIVPLSRGGPR